MGKESRVCISHRKDTSTMIRYVYCRDEVTNETMFLERDRVESAEYRLGGKHRVRQLIPYIVVVNKEGKIGAFQRIKGDKRLVNGVTIGVGGHVEPIDTVGKSKDILFSAAYRELEEELDISDPASLEMTNININSDSTAVDSVHSGVVFVVEPKGRLTCRDGELEFLGWKTFNELAHMNLESWSTLIRKDLEKWMLKPFSKRVRE